MSAKVSEIYECPKCNHALSGGVRPKKCPSESCGYIFPSPEEELAKKFSWGKAPYSQLFDLVLQDVDKYKTLPISALIPSIPKKAAEEMTVHPKTKKRYIDAKRTYEMREFYLNSSPDDIRPWLESIMDMYQVIHKSGNKDLIFLMIFWGERFGQYARSLRRLMEQGAQTYDRINPKFLSGDSERSYDDVEGKGDSDT